MNTDFIKLLQREQDKINKHVLALDEKLYYADEKQGQKYLHKIEKLNEYKDFIDKALYWAEIEINPKYKWVLKAL